MVRCPPYPVRFGDRTVGLLRRAALGALALVLHAALAGAQTPVPIRVANDLRACIADTHGFRDAARIGQLETSMAQLPNRRWTSVTEVAPGVFRITGALAQITIEIKLPDTNGDAHCMAFGPDIGLGQGALSADKFVDLNFLTGFQADAPAEGVTRRYALRGAPHPAALVAFTSPQVGDVVGFSFSGIPKGQTNRVLSRGDPAITQQTVRTRLGQAINVCLRRFGNFETVDAALSAYGFELGFETGGGNPSRVFFSPDNSVSIQVATAGCYIETNYMSAPATVAATGVALATDAPGLFNSSTDNKSGCTTFFAGPNLNKPIYLQVNTARQQGRSTCADDGTSRITISVAG